VLEVACFSWYTRHFTFVAFRARARRLCERLEATESDWEPISDNPERRDSCSKKLLLLAGYFGRAIAPSHHDVTINTFIKILLFNARDHGRLVGTKQRKFTENRSKNCINSRREME